MDITTTIKLCDSYFPLSWSHPYKLFDYYHDMMLTNKLAVYFLALCFLWAYKIIHDSVIKITHFQFQTPCCNKVYVCRYCHDENEQHYFNRKSVTELICTECDKRQKVQEVCENCGVRFGKVCYLFYYLFLRPARQRSSLAFTFLPSITLQRTDVLGLETWLSSRLTQFLSVSIIKLITYVIKQE